MSDKQDECCAAAMKGLREEVSSESVDNADQERELKLGAMEVLATATQAIVTLTEHLTTLLAFTTEGALRLTGQEIAFPYGELNCETEAGDVVAEDFQGIFDHLYPGGGGGEPPPSPPL